MQIGGLGPCGDVVVMLFRPFEACSRHIVDSRLAPWALFLRRFAAGRCKFPVSWRVRLLHEFYLRGIRDQACLVSHVEELTDGFAAVGAVVEGAIVHVHSYEFVG
jgi:hypothetical protein